MTSTSHKYFDLFVTNCRLWSCTVLVRVLATHFRPCVATIVVQRSLFRSLDHISNPNFTSFEIPLTFQSLGKRIWTSRSFFQSCPSPRRRHILHLHAHKCRIYIHFAFPYRFACLDYHSQVPNFMENSITVGKLQNILWHGSCNSSCFGKEWMETTNFRSIFHSRPDDNDPQSDPEYGGSRGSFQSLFRS